MGANPLHHTSTIRLHLGSLLFTLPTLIQQGFFQTFEFCLHSLQHLGIFQLFGFQKGFYLGGAGMGRFKYMIILIFFLLFRATGIFLEYINIIIHNLISKRLFSTNHRLYFEDMLTIIVVWANSYDQDQFSRRGVVHSMPFTYPRMYFKYKNCTSRVPYHPQLNIFCGVHFAPVRTVRYRHWCVEVSPESNKD